MFDELNCLDDILLLDMYVESMQEIMYEDYSWIDVMLGAEY